MEIYFKQTETATVHFIEA